MPDTTGRPPFPLPPGRHVELPGRGTTFVHEVAGPPGAPALVLLHGLGPPAALNWFATYRPLGGHSRFVAPHHRRPGHGRALGRRPLHAVGHAPAGDEPRPPPRHRRPSGPPVGDLGTAPERPGDRPGGGHGAHALLVPRLDRRRRRPHRGGRHRPRPS